MIKLFSTTSIFISLLAVTVAFGFLSINPVKAAEPTHNADFRIIEVSDHQSYLLIEVEHFKTDGTFDYFENYIWQGREGKKFPTLANAEGRRFMDNGELAPFTVDPYLPPGNYSEYLPPGRSWKIDYDPRIDRNALLTVIEGVHKKRSNWADSDWPKGYKTGQSRLSEPGMKYDQTDANGIFSLIVKFQNLTDTAYTIKEAESPRRYIGEMPPVNPGEGKFEYGTVATFYPGDGDSMDAFTVRQVASAGEAWSSQYGGAGTNSSTAMTSYYPNLNSGQTTDKWYLTYRIVQLYDTSAIGSGSTVTSATMDFIAMAVYEGLVGRSLAMVTSSPASNTAIVDADYAYTLWGSVRQAPDKLLSGITADSSTYNSYALDATGLGNISKTGTTKFGLRIDSDADNSPPTWFYDKLASVQVASSQETLSGDKRPRLVVTYSLPPTLAAITGTIGAGATEQEVRDGGGTIIVTLTDDTWVTAGATFNAQRQAIIDGLDAADAQTNGWNTQVRDQLGVSSVVRTSNTIATITIADTDVTGYAIATNETITATVPAAALAVSAIDVTATPTITITANVESAAVSGTLGGSGGTAAEIVAGGETVIITLTNTTWVAAGATFNAQRQNILDGLVADDSDVNGWNAMAFAVGDVVRTSGTIVTITLSAESGYAIPSAETVTTTVPASAVNYGAALVAPETFTISPAAFATSGTRVSTAINLSGITDLAYCAIGWETTLPANTTVAIETSINGGSTYSTATNGNCPTGLTLGESLSTITDFRVKGTLTTTNTAATPLITALGLIVEDAGGSTLCYQLKTTPSASLADNCGTYTGTMSFPIGPSTITNTTAPITSTADALPNARSLAGQDVAQAVTGSATSGRLFPAAGDEGGFVGLPLNDLVNDMSTVGDGLPVRFVWFIFLGIATIGAGMLAVHLTSNLFIAAGAMAAVMGFQMAIGSTGLLPGWILFAFIPLAGSFLLFRRGFPV